MLPVLFRKGTARRGEYAGWRPLRLIVLLAGLVLSLSLAAAPGQASRTEITVVEDRWAIDFPNRVNFDLTAAADQEITEVRLRYRPVGSQVWAYGYPAFDPAQRVTAKFSLNTRGGGFLPPGTQVEYYYVISDEHGNVHETPPAVLEYSDTRFQWEHTQAGPLELVHHDIPQSAVNEVAGKVKVDLERLAELLQIETERPIRGIIYNRRSAAMDAFPYQSRTITEQHVYEGFAFPERGLFLGVGLEPSLIIHESAHVLLHQALGPASRPIPAWLNEGFASYVEPGANPYSGRSLSSLDLPLEAMSTVPGTPRAIGAFYVKAESVVAYLMEEHGVESFQRFLGRLREGRSADDALVLTYGFDTSGLEARWSASSRGRTAPEPGRPERPSLFMYLDTWAIGILALVVLAVTLVRYVAGKLRPDPDPEEGLQPWEDPDLFDRR